MKPYISVILAIATLFVCTDLEAQERMFGRGRFIKRLQENAAKAQKEQQLRREREAVAKKKEAARKQAAAKSRAAAKAKANAKAPTPIKRSQNVRQPTPSGKASRNAKATAGQRQLASNKRIVPSKDFGMVIKKNKDDNFFVASVTPGGNAAKVGIRAGDQIVELGGAKIVDMEEIESIANIMSPGDQMEFTVQSGKGKPRKEMVQWGDAPEPKEVESADDLVGAEEAESDFEALRSVLDTPATQSTYRPSLRPESQQTLDQRRKIEELQRQIQLLQSQQPSPLRDGPPINGPALNGPRR